MKSNKKFLYGFVLGSALFATIGVHAATTYFARDIGIQSNKTTKTNLQDVLDELYDKANSKCPTSMIGSSWEYDYTGREDTFLVPCAGAFKIEVWGASGATANSTSIGGAGAYATGTINLRDSETLFINVGGQGNSSSATNRTPIYNGGGLGVYGYQHKPASDGGGASSVTFTSGILASHVDTEGNPKLSEVVIVAGGGGGLYGGAGSCAAGGGGGSSYIGNARLNNKGMYCLNCIESNDESTKTISVMTKSETPKENTPKIGNGYIKITLVD